MTLRRRAVKDEVPKKVNGNDVEIHYGDDIIPLPERLDKQETDIIWLRRMIVALVVLLIVHSLVPMETLIPWVLKIIGL